MYMARKEVLTRAFQNIGHLFQKWQNIHIYRAARVHRKPTLSLPQEKTKTRTVKSAEAAFMMTKKKKKGKCSFPPSSNKSRRMSMRMFDGPQVTIHMWLFLQISTQ